MANNQGNNIHTATHSAKSNDENSNENERLERETMQKSINNETSSGYATNEQTVSKAEYSFFPNFSRGLKQQILVRVRLLVLFQKKTKERS